MQDLVLESKKLVYMIWMFCVCVGGKDLLPNVSITRRILNIQTGKKNLQETPRHQIAFSAPKVPHLASNKICCFTNFHPL